MSDFSSDNRGELRPDRRTRLANQDRDAETVRLLRARLDEGLRRLLDHHGGTVAQALSKELNVDAHRVDDAIGAAIHRIWLEIDRYDAEQGSLRAWFYIIARNFLRNARRARRHEGIRDALEYLEKCLVQPTSESDEAPRSPTEREVTLRESIEFLPPLQRAVIEADLRAGGVAPGDELAKELNSTPNSIYAARSKAMRRLKELIHEAENGPEAPWS